MDNAFLYFFQLPGKSDPKTLAQIENMFYNKKSRAFLHQITASFLARRQLRAAVGARATHERMHTHQLEHNHHQTGTDCKNGNAAHLLLLAAPATPTTAANPEKISTRQRRLTIGNVPGNNSGKNGNDSGKKIGNIGNAAHTAPPPDGNVRQ